ncbi:hypothetical protein GE061_019887 [Apolygus lucorum]|uniref:G-protein coupled receptors family 1 profile domain-containing protein n=1 Tax=Apolygus lucorum TaxID=248454 RepID=A0A8S9XB01_APOLU|nr:hypothetical protein GE061_019887 [Apolygus lucorum]
MECSGSVVGATRVSSESTCPMLAGRTRRRPQVQATAPNRKLRKRDDTTWDTRLAEHFVSQLLTRRTQYVRRIRTWQPVRSLLIRRRKSGRFQLAKERKASTTLGIIMSAFTICWLPFFVLAVVRPFLANEDAIPGSLSSLFLWLGYANSLLNPVIYATLNRDFRRPFQQILYFRCGSLNLMMREEFYQSQYGNPNPPNFNDDEPTCDLMPLSGRSEERRIGRCHGFLETLEHSLKQPVLSEGAKFSTLPPSSVSAVSTSTQWVLLFIFSP